MGHIFPELLNMQLNTIIIKMNRIEELIQIKERLKELFIKGNKIIKKRLEDGIIK